MHIDKTIVWSYDVGGGVVCIVVDIFVSNWLDGTNMKKSFCYPKYASIAHLVLFLLFVALCIYLLISPKELDINEWFVAGMCILVFCILYSIWGVIHFSQYVCIKNNKIILRTLFYTIKELNVDECCYEVCRLSTYVARRYVMQKWICIYSVEETKKFIEGFSNGRKFKRIQLTYSRRNLEFVNRYIKPTI